MEHDLLYSSEMKFLELLLIVRKRGARYVYAYPLNLFQQFNIEESSILCLHAHGLTSGGVEPGDYIAGKWESLENRIRSRRSACLCGGEFETGFDQSCL